MSKFDFSKTIGGQILADSLKGWGESLVVSNELLPPELHDEVRGGRTIARLQEIFDEQDRVETTHQKIKATKARNVQKLAEQVAASSRYNERGDFVDIDCELDYNVCECDDVQLTKNMIAIVNGMVNRGIIDSNDLLRV